MTFEIALYYFTVNLYICTVTIVWQFTYMLTAFNMLLYVLLQTGFETIFISKESILK